MTHSQAPTSRDYDQYPYRGRPCTDSHPSRLFTAATLLGLQPAPADISRCRVLEVACGDGINLLSIAESLPGATCVGIDLAARHIDTARADAATLGLQNVRFQQADILTLGKEDLGEFDYVIAHGLYSWVPRVVQDRLLSICKQHLAPGGVAFISYNVLPGWRIHSILRDFILFHTRGMSSTAEKLKGAREALALFGEFGKADPGEMLRFVSGYSEVFKDHLSGLGDWADSLILYDALPTINTPVYFSAFAGHINEHGLQYLAEADFQMPMPGVIPGVVLEKVSEVVQSQSEMEQYLDFYRMRMFRQSLICHAEAELPGKIDAAPVSEMYVSALAQPVGKVDAASSEQAVFKAPSDKSLTTNHPLTKAAMLHLIEQWPRAVHFPKLVEAAAARLRGKSAPAVEPDMRTAATLAVNLVRAFAHGPGLIFLNATAPELAESVPARPRTRALARLQAVRGHEVTNAFHDNIGLPKLALRILALLDGSRDHAALRADLRRGSEAKQLDLAAYSSVDAALSENLEILRSMGLILK